MRGSEVKIGQAYLARVSGVLCRVEVVRELFARRGTRWAVMNTRTGRMIEVSAARLSPIDPVVREVVRVIERVAFVKRPDYQPTSTEDVF